MIVQGVLFAAETLVMHHVGSRIPVTQLALLRGMGGLALAALLARHLGIGMMRTHQLALQLLRGSVSLLYLWVMIYSFTHLPFADATAISYTSAVYIPAFSMLILGERVTWLQWTAALIGIAGALLVAEPGFGSWNSAYFVALIGTTLNGLAFVLNKYLQRQDTEVTTLFYTNVVLVVGSAPVLAAVSVPSAETAPWLPSLLALGPIGMYLGILAVKHASASALGSLPHGWQIRSIAGGARRRAIAAR